MVIDPQCFSFTYFVSYGHMPSIDNYHRVDDQNNRHSFSLNHDINLNFSKALKVILRGLVEPIIKSPIIFGEPASCSITFTFHV